MEKISAYIITLNDKDKIRRTLESVSFCDEIVVVHNGSNDGTLAICEEFGAKIIEQDWLGFAKQKQFALDACQYEWCLNLDSDEEVSQELMESIREILRSGTECSAFSIRRYNKFLGMDLPAWMHKDSVVRLFRKGKVRYNDVLVHEKVIVDGKIGNLAGHILHYSKETLAICQNDVDSYSSLSAKEKFEAGKKLCLPRFYLTFPFTFIKKYFIDRAFLLGSRGFIYAVMESYYSFMKQAKLWEMHIQSEEKNKS